MKTYNVPRWIKNDKSFPFWFSLIQESNIFIDFSKITNILDFGSGNGKFLKLIDLYFSGKTLVGVEIDTDLISQSNENSKDNINYFHTNKLKSVKDEFFSIIYSQEVVYTLSDLPHHAKNMFRLLDVGGHYIFTVGCHIDNPTWYYRKSKILETEKYTANDYSLEYIAKTFFDAGFRVTVKRLPVHYPLKYVPDYNNEFTTIKDLLVSSEENKLLFVLLKPKKD